ncbi:hypothetical protein LOZ58_005762 [Ophidiomyces ophidiicola]|nr:hypothetical protein LOZ58_005762 [Ophidiomyces ophidiicola]
MRRDAAASSGHDHDRTACDPKPADCSGLVLKSSSSTPSSTNDSFSHLSISTAASDALLDEARPRRPDSPLASPAHLKQYNETHRSFASHTFTRTMSSSTLPFSCRTYSTDSDDVVPKVEEIDDEEAFAIESSKDQVITRIQLDTPESKSSFVPVPVVGPRKRGRPRKHPLPLPGQIKATKGRSKTGCVTCRRRKKKCDETKPSCLNCQKNSVVCEGYPAKEIWKSGKQKLEEAARRCSLAVIPRELPNLIDGVETDVDRRFLDHFVYDFSRVLTLINDDSNPFKEILMPMATQHTGLMHSLMCLSGSHLSARDPDPRFQERKHYHFDRAITDLRSTIVARSTGNGKEPEFLVEDPMIASTIALYRRPICLTGDLRLPDFIPHAQAGALLGIFDGLFLYISEITVIRDKIRQRINQKCEPAVDYQTLSEAVTIDSKIRAWEPSYPPNHQNWFAAQLYRQSTWIYLYRTIRPSRPNEKISQVVDDGLLFLDQLPLNAGAFSILLMPLFLLGCSAFEPHQRDRIKKGFNSLQTYSSLRNIKPAFCIVEKVWDIMDTNPDQSWDWEKIIDDMNMDFLIT